MRVISRKALLAFGVLYPDAVGPLDVWYRRMKAGRFNTPEDIRAHFAGPSFLSGDRVVFNIAGNKYRLVVGVDYPYACYVRHVLTHEEYDDLSNPDRL